MISAEPTMSNTVDGLDPLDAFYARTRPLGVHASRRFLHLELDLINRCNLRCVMCYHSQEHARRARTTHMMPEMFAAIAERLLPHCSHLSLSLGNEPLMSPYFADVLTIAAPYGVPNVNFFTNALLLDAAKIDSILAGGVTQVCVSIDGASPAIYDGIRRGGEFDTVVANVDRLVQSRESAGASLPVVRFDVVMMQRNVHELPDLVRLASRLGVGQICFQHVIAFDGLDMERESLRYTRALSNFWLDRALTLARELAVHVTQHPAFFELDPASASADAAPAAPFTPTPYCTYPFFHVSISPGGFVLPCPYSHGEAPWGQVSKKTPADLIWLSAPFVALRRRILAHDPPAMCRRCPSLANRYPDVAALFATRHN
jgi:MoaA/NifB/PqqE/SkfB family radical SAM enzyme